MYLNYTLITILNQVQSALEGCSWYVELFDAPTGKIIKMCQSNQVSFKVTQIPGNTQVSQQVFCKYEILSLVSKHI